MDDDSRTDWSLTRGPIASAADGSQTPAIELRGITKHFGANNALDNVSIAVKSGTIHALLGENGAGKTTLMRIAFGLIAADAGDILRHGEIVAVSSPAKAIAAGIGMVHQQFSLVPAMTVAENIALGGHGLYRPKEVARKIHEVGNRTGLTLDPMARVADLTNAERQKLEIVRTLAHDATVLILDEPTAVLTPGDVSELFIQLKTFAAAGGSVVLITHKLEDALEHADEVSVLRRGRLVLNAPMHSVTRESLTMAMLGGTSPLPRTKKNSPAKSTVVASVLSLDGTSDIDVFAGEILGVSALEGKATQLLRALAGRVTPSGSTITTPDTVGFVPENRQDEALIDDFSLTENLALKSSGRRQGRINWRQFRNAAFSVIRRFDVHADGPDNPIRNLSGGNQQRFVMGRELDDRPLLLVLENPTQGLDVNAATAVHERIRAARNSGTGIVFYSSDLDELAQIADRVAVVSSSGIQYTVPDRSEIGRLLLGIETPGSQIG